MTQVTRSHQAVARSLVDGDSEQGGKILLLDPDEVVCVAGLAAFASDLSLLACVDSVAPMMAHIEIGDGG